MNEGLMPMTGTVYETSHWLEKNQLPSSLHSKYCLTTSVGSKRRT